MATYKAETLTTYRTNTETQAGTILCKKPLFSVKWGLSFNFSGKLIIAKKPDLKKAICFL